jgi:hypothetical protein
MPILENKPDRRGRPIYPTCAHPILPRDGIALMEDSMIHADCVSRPPPPRRCYPDRPSQGLTEATTTSQARPQRWW